MDNGLSFDELTELKKDIEYISKNNIKELSKIIKKSGNKAKSRIVRLYKSNLNKKTGKLFKAVKTSRVLISDIHNNISIKVYVNKFKKDGAPHSHLIEYGHNIVARGEAKTKAGRRSGAKGKPLGKTRAFGIFSMAERQLEAEFLKDVQSFTNDFFKDL